jgi:hypothetical protein
MTATRTATPYVGPDTRRRPAPVSADRLMWHAETRSYVTEISDLGRRPFGQVWDDACDEGLTLISRHDGSEHVFVVHETVRDADNDIAYWLLVPVSPRDRAAGVTVKIFND